MEFVHFSITVGWLGVGDSSAEEAGGLSQDVGARLHGSVLTSRSSARVGFLGCGVDPFPGWVSDGPPVWTGPEDSLLLSCGAPSNSVPIGPLGVRAEEGRGRWALGVRA